ncbi:LPXTG_cell wall anchor domain-containing protein [Hexamita inflata]|uniref:LPXTG cell wall anchor domain-containing protein n=1 Tax=Hexamita inflata TaxID=28002 RepID=A0AA86Q5E8_9EUKA|nr:LPXTG cell wall anchor domain-containing protein [Hexamita inflata]
MNLENSLKQSEEEIQDMQYEKHINRIKNGSLKIKKDGSLIDLSFTQRFQLDQLYLTSCHYVSFQYAFSQTCTVFQADKCKIKNLSGIEQIQSIRSLFLYDNKIEDISPLRSIKSIDTLNIGNNKIIDISPLNQLSNLKSLNLSNNSIVNLSQIKELYCLETLYVISNNISSLFGIQNLKNLQTLGINNNKITSLNGIQNLKCLKVIYAENNKITDLYGVHHLKNLCQLFLCNNQIQDLSPLSGCCSLVSLEIINNQIVDVSPLQHNLELRYMIIEQNYISNFQNINKLQNFGILQRENQKQPSLAQIQTSARMKTIFTTKSHLEYMSINRTAIISRFESVTQKSELLINAITNFQLNLSNKLLQVFGTVEDASQ